MKDIERTACEEIEKYARYGFYQSAEIERIVGDDILGGALPRKRIRELVKAEKARQEAEQKAWPAVTDCDRLDRAFVALRAADILAVDNAGMTPSEGIDEVSEQYHAAGGKKSDIIGYCVYHRQDMADALKDHRLGLAFGAIDGNAVRGVKIGQRVRKTLEAEGLQVVWSGSLDDKLNVAGFTWQRRG